LIVIVVLIDASSMHLIIAYYQMPDMVSNALGASLYADRYFLTPKKAAPSPSSPRYLGESSTITGRGKVGIPHFCCKEIHFLADCHNAGSEFCYDSCMQNKEISTCLSKSLFIRGLQCHKSLYLHKYHPELRNEVSEEKEALFQTGFEVGKYAQQLFPGGIEIPYDENSYDAQIQKTQDEIRKGTKTIYEAAFNYDDIFVKVDILHKDHEGWKIFEVKSLTELKPVYIDDAAIQYYVLNGAGLPVSKVFLAHINNQYVRDGEIDPRGLFTSNDISDSVRQKQPYIADNIAKQKEMLKNDMPDIDIGEYCEKPYECDFQGHCWQHIPQDSVFDLKRKGVNKYDLYRQGIIELKNIPLGHDG